MSDPDLYRSGITENKIYELEQKLKDLEKSIKDLRAQTKQELLDVGQRLRMGLKEEAQYYIDEIKKAHKEMNKKPLKINVQIETNEAIEVFEVDISDFYLPGINEKSTAQEIVRELQDQAYGMDALMDKAKITTTIFYNNTEFKWNGE